MILTIDIAILRQKRIISDATKSICMLFKYNVHREDKVYEIITLAVADCIKTNKLIGTDIKVYDE